MIMSKVTSKEVSVAISSYYLVGLIWYVMDKETHTPFTKFHVKQAINYSLISYVVYGIIIITALYLLLPSNMLYENSLIAIVLLLIMGFMVIFFFSLFVIQSNIIFEKKKEKMPFIGKIADKYLKMD